ncbi:uncharacterized protein TNCV_1439581 [Trichonephila clavipes]|nr:uncharacterized protein TNCV_1439581 [Trichonephila clavipes]
MALGGSLPQINLGVQGWALDWFEVLGYRFVEDKATDYAHLKQALSEQFPVVRNRSELETRFYSSSQKHNQKPSDFVYDLLKIHKILILEMMEEKLIDHIISRLEPQILDYVEYGGDRSRGTENPPDTEHQTIRVSSLRMTPVDLPYVPILLNETFITALWDTGAEKSFISEEVYRKYFSYRPRQRTKYRVMTAHGAPCCHLGRVELQFGSENSR